MSNEVTGKNLDNEIITVRLGDRVYFKSDMECSGKVVAIRGKTLQLADCDTQSNYGKSTATVSLQKCWLEG